MIRHNRLEAWPSTVVDLMIYNPPGTQSLIAQKRGNGTTRTNVEAANYDAPPETVGTFLERHDPI